MTDARTEAAALAILGEDQWPTNAELGGGLTGTRDDEVRDQFMDDARDALAAADAVDAAQGVRRVQGTRDTMVAIVAEHWVEKWNDKVHPSAVRCMKPGCDWQGRFPGQIAEHNADLILEALA